MKGFGEYGFPNRTRPVCAAGGYVSCWLKRHYPAAFTCGLLNSQTLGFIRLRNWCRTRRVGATVLPVDVRVRRVTSCLERIDEQAVSQDVVRRAHHERLEKKPPIHFTVRAGPSLSKHQKSHQPTNPPSASACTPSKASPPKPHNASSKPATHPFSDPADLKRRAQLTSHDIASLAPQPMPFTPSPVIGAKRCGRRWRSIRTPTSSTPPADGAQGVLRAPNEAENVFGTIERQV